MLPNMKHYEVLDVTPDFVEFAALYEGEPVQRVRGTHGEDWFVARPVIGNIVVPIPLFLCGERNGVWRVEWRSELPKTMLCKLYEQGHDVRSLAAIFGYGKSMIHELLVQEQTPMRSKGAVKGKKKLTMEDVVVLQYNQGESIESIATFVHRNHKTVAQILRARNVSLRSSHEQLKLRLQKERG